MSAKRFKIVDSNPNDDIGGGGCLCSPDKVTDCKGPYAVFYATEAGDTPFSPHVVIGAGCIAAAAEQLDGEVLRVSQNTASEQRQATLDKFSDIYAPPTTEREVSVLFDAEADAEETPTV